MAQNKQIPDQTDNVSPPLSAQSDVQSVDPIQKQNTDTPKSAQPIIVKKSGTALSLFALLLSVLLGCGGYFLYLHAHKHIGEFSAKLTALESKSATLPDQEVAMIRHNYQKSASLENAIQSIQEKLLATEQQLAEKNHVIESLQTQIEHLAASTKAQQPNDWLLSEADFLLNNALRKLVLDNDVETAVSLLKIADETLSKVADPQVGAVKKAINDDLKLLFSLNNVDQNAIMQRLSQLANTIDELNVLDINFENSSSQNENLTDSLADWKENAQKSAVGFLNHFIRITPKSTDIKPLLAPNQDIYLRENIRLRLQLALMAVPRQQNELYKQSLETVASWVRSYFDSTSPTAQLFLKEVDELAEQSIYVDVPTQLNSLNMLDKWLKKSSKEVSKIQLSVDKSVSEPRTGTHDMPTSLPTTSPENNP